MSLPGQLHRGTVDIMPIVTLESTAGLPILSA